jgi:CRP-like cAMP-binding protein
MIILSKFINNSHPLPEKSFKKFLQITELKTFSKKDVLTKYGETPKELFILKSGVVRSYYTDKKSKEYIRSLFTPFNSKGSLGALVSNKPS